MFLSRDNQTLQDIILEEYFNLAEKCTWLASNEYWIFLIKPDGLSLNVDGCSFRQFLLNIVDMVWFDVLETYRTSLNLNELKILFPPFWADISLRDWRKDDFKKYMLNREVEIILFYWKGAIEKSCILKQVIRESLIKPQDNYHKVIANLLHSVDREDFETSYKLLFKRQYIYEK